SPPILFAHFPKSSSNWLSEGVVLRFGLRMMPTDRTDTVLATVESGETYPIRVVRRRLPRDTGTALWHLYRLTRVGTKLVDYLGLRCHGCAGLRFRPQGRNVMTLRAPSLRPSSKGHRKIAPLPRCPWDPRAVSDPRLVAGELFQLEEARNSRSHPSAVRRP